MGFSLKKLGQAIYHGLNTNDNGQGWTSQAPTPQQVQQYQQTSHFNPVNNSLTRGLSRAYDQVNMWDNNRTWQHTTPTNTKSTFQQTGQLGGQFARSSATGLAQMANTFAAQVPQVYYTVAQQAAARTHNPIAYQNATRNVEIANSMFQRGKGGLLNVGTLYNADEARSGDLKTGLKRIGGGTAQAMTEAASMMYGGTSGKALLEQGVKKGLQTQAPNLAKNFLLNTAQGGITAYNNGASKQDILKNAALSGITGTAGDLALGIGGAYAGKGLSKAVNTVKSTPLNQGGYIKISNPGGAKTKKLQINNPDGAKTTGLQINNPMGANIKKPLKVNNPMGADTRAKINIKNNTGAPLVGEDIYGAAKQAFESARPPKDGDVTMRMWEDYLQNPGRKTPSNSLAGEGAMAPTDGLSSSAKTDLMSRVRAKVKADQGGSAPMNSPVMPLSAVVSKIREMRANRAQQASSFSPDQYAKENAVLRKAATEGDKAPLIPRVRSELSTKLVDSLSPIEKPVEAIVGRQGNLKMRNQLDRALRADTIGGQFAKDNGLHNIIQTVDNPKVFNEYLLAKHAQALEANGVKTGRNLAKDQQLIDAVGPKYEAHAAAVADYSHKLLDQSVEYGLISKETAAYLKQKYPNYVPFDRVFSDAELQGKKGVGSGPASLSTQTVVQRIKGSTRQVQPPLESLIAKTGDLVKQGERNLAAREVASTAKLPGNPLGIRELKPGETIGTRPTISYLENGVKRTFETTPEVAAAAKSLNKQQLGVIGKVFAAPTRVLRLGATGVNAGFALANVVKDTASAFINTDHALRASAANPKVFVEALSAAFHHGGKQYGELVREGAGGTSFDIARNAAPQTFKDIRANRNIATHTFRVVTHPGELLRAVEDTIGRSEEFGRAVQYFGNKEAALAKGKSLAEAKAYGADAARNNTVNFSRAGEYGRVVNTVVPYLNAGVQGSRTLLRNLRDKPVQTTTKLVLTAFMPVAATTAWNINDPERRKIYDSISETEKQNNIIIIPPNAKQDSKGRWNVIKIPVSQEVANLNNIVRDGVLAAKDNKNINFADMAKNLFGTGTSLNAQDPNQLVSQLTPQAVKPFMETTLNKNLYTGQQIVPDAMKNLSPQDQVNANTSGTARVIGRVTGQSPLKIDNAIRTTTGGGGQNLLHYTDTALNKAGVIPADQIQGKDLRSSITSRFNSAQGKTPGAQYFSTIQDVSKKNKLVGRDYEALQAILAKEIDGNGNPIKQNDKDTLWRNSTLANNPAVAKTLSDTAKQLNQTTGKPIDPLFNLSDQQQNIYYRLQATPYKSDDYNKLTRDNKDWLDNLRSQRQEFFKQNPIAPGAENDKVKYPTFNSTTQAHLDEYYGASPQEKTQILKQYPDVNKALQAIGQYTNDKRVAQGYAPFKEYPKAPPEVDQFMRVPKASRKYWIQSHPKEYSKVQDYFAQSSAYQLANNASEGRYQGETLNQKTLKAAYSLGQYDIAKNPDGSYSLDPAAASANNYASRYGGRGGSNTVALKRTSVKGTVAKAIVKTRSPGKLQGSVKYATGGKPKVTIKKSMV